MEVVKEFLGDVLLIQPKIFKDDRGYFSETYNARDLEKIIGKYDFVQDNQSLSQKGVLRGMHFQKNPFAQGKLVRVLSGAVMDVVVDLRTSSPTFGQHCKVELNSDSCQMLWVPPGFAHGFLTLENDTVFFYKVTNYYDKDSEVCLRWDDETVNIDWNVVDPIVSEKDKVGLDFSAVKDLF